MTDKVVPGSDAGATGNPNQQNQSAVNTETEMPEWAVELQKETKEALAQARAAQSGKDQLAAGQLNLQTQLDKAQSTFAEAAQYLGEYANPAEAERNWWIDQQMKQSRSENQEVDPNVQQNQTLAGQGADAGEVDLTQFGVDPQSAEYLEQVRQGKVGFEAALNVLAARQTQNVEGNATGASGGAGGTTASTTTQQQVLLDQYNVELDEAVKLTKGVLRPNDLFRIQSKYAGLGLTNLV